VRRFRVTHALCPSREEAAPGWMAIVGSEKERGRERRGGRKRWLRVTHALSPFREEAAPGWMAVVASK